MKRWWYNPLPTALFLPHGSPWRAWPPGSRWTTPAATVGGHGSRQPFTESDGWRDRWHVPVFLCKGGLVEDGDKGL
jgi:hypothetical protein